MRKTKEIEELKENNSYGRKGTQKDQEKKDLYRYQASIRAGSRVRKLCLANGLAYHWTLTYSENMQEREIAAKDFVLFIKRLRYKVGDKIPYVAVMETQKRGAIHFHLALDRKINHSLVDQCWGKGYVFVTKISGDVAGVASYLSKYLKKELELNPRDENQKRYFSSQGLKEPTRDKVLIKSTSIGKLLENASAKREFAPEENEYISSWLQVPTEFYQAVHDE